MAHVDRKPKAGGSSRYTDEVQRGFDLIRETEVDRDFDDLYGEFNGGIDDTNIRPGASIDYSKLDLTGRIKGTDLDPNIVLPPGTVIPPGTTFPPNGVDTPALAIDATTQFAHQVDTALPRPIALTDTAEHVLVTITASPASRGGLIVVIGHCSGWMGAPSPEVILTTRVRMGGTGTNGTVIANTQVVAQNTGTEVVPFQGVVLALPRGTSGSAGPFYLNAMLSIAGGPFIGSTASIYEARLIAFELA